MRKGLQKILAVMLILALTFTVEVNFTANAEESVDVTILATSDIHGRLMAYDYSSDASAATGLTTVATVIKQERAKNPDLIYVDNGDITQGNMISDFRTNDIHPAVVALNALKCDIWELGNHEFNFDFKLLEKEIKDFNGTVLAGNIYKKDGTRYLDAYKIFDIKGVKVAIFGIEAPHVTVWEATAPDHFNNMKFTTPMEETGKILDEIEKAGADVVVGVCHYGEDGEYDLAGTGGMNEVAKKYADRVDAFIVGHSHAVTNKSLVKGEWQDGCVAGAQTYVIEPGTNGEYVSKVNFTVVKDGGKWTVKAAANENIATAGLEEDPDLVKVLKEHHEASIALSNSVIGQVGADFFENGENQWLPGIGYAFIQDSAIIDLINKVQMEVTGADVSLAALLDANANLKKGDYKKKDGALVYKYDNTLFAVKCTGKQLKQIMQLQAGNYFNTWKEGDVTLSFNPTMRAYNFDAFAGVTYEIDVTKPEGKKVVNIKYKGKKLKDDEQLILAINNYRLGQMETAGILREEDVVFNSTNDYPTPAVRDMISEYVIKMGTLMPECDNNWKIVGADLNDPQAEEIYDMIRAGEIEIPMSEDGRCYNVKAINANELREQGILEPLSGDAAANTYVVAAGDYLRKIAKKLLGDESLWKEIYNANKKTISNPDVIFVGQVLAIPQ